MLVVKMSEWSDSLLWREKFQNAKTFWAYFLFLFQINKVYAHLEQSAVWSVCASFTSALISQRYAVHGRSCACERSEHFTWDLALTWYALSLSLSFLNYMNFFLFSTFYFDEKPSGKVRDADGLAMCASCCVLCGHVSMNAIECGCSLFTYILQYFHQCRNHFYGKWIIQFIKRK